MLETAIEIIRKHHYNVYSLCEWENGKMRQEALQPANRLNNCYSLSKSFTSAAVGMLEYENKLSREDTIDAYIADLFPAENAEKLRQVKIRDLLSHAAGFAEGTLFEGDQYDHETDDWATYSLSRPLPYPPARKACIPTRRITCSRASRNGPRGAPRSITCATDCSARSAFGDTPP